MDESYLKGRESLLLELFRINKKPCKIYKFNSASQECKTFTGEDYVLKGYNRLIKLDPLLTGRRTGIYYNLIDGNIIDCSGYIEERCLEKEEE